MLSVVTALSLLAVAQGDAPRPVEIFAKEAFYKEVEWVGILKKTPQKDGVIGFGRVNPFRLEMEGNKVREVYIGGKPKLLDPYVGKKVKIVGKAVDMEVEGRQHHEIWPASLVVLAGDKKDDAKDASPKKEEKAGGLTIHAKTPAKIAAGPVVIRSAEQLAKLTNSDADKATAQAAKMLKVDGIDWSKRMIIVISGGTQRTGGYSVEAKSLDVKDGKLVVSWKLNTPAPGSIVTQALTNPAQSILVDRFEGDVVFDPVSPPPGGFNKKLGGS
jgi:hypothetical protein